jgi:hypothetical protein
MSLVYRLRKAEVMAKNPPKDNARRGSVNDRTQFKHPTSGNWIKRDTTTGRFLDQKTSPGPFKGVAREPDARRD